ncbi:MAG: 3-methyl-2-oxobutanoate hydroxymethyltransferase [Candidatus Binatus sp.]|nr:3-methyl-2-oxobutanoate hydroxymethyltransferase [Candidatus Binatus sp.]
MNRETRCAKAEAFRAMHDRKRILVLPNAWDAFSARVIESTGARAIATSSAGVALSIGYPDGEVAPRDEIVDAIARIARVVEVPVSADIESGFAAGTRELADTIRDVIEAGAVGINLEDATRNMASPLYDLETAVERVRAARAAADQSGIPLVINARTDVYLLSVGAPETRFDNAVARLNAYRAAGADCLFLPRVAKPEDIARFVAALEGPLNLLAMPGIPPVAELERLGVARLSAGSGPAFATMGLTRKIARELLDGGEYTAMFADPLSYPEANELMTGRPDRES